MANIHVHFHVGRGGRFYNSGHYTFVGEHTFDWVIRYTPNLFLHTSTFDEDGNDKPLPDEAWTLEDGAGNVILQGRDEIESDCGVLDIDGDYNKDIVTTTDDLTDRELQCLWKAYQTNEYMSEELKDEVCTLVGYKRVHSIKDYHSNFVAYYQDGHKDFVSDEYKGTDLDTIREELESEAFDEFSIEKILDMIDTKGWTDEIDEDATEEDFILHTLRKARDDQGITLKALSDMTGINPSNLSRIERGEVSPTLTSLLAIAKALGKSVIIE